MTDGIPAAAEGPEGQVARGHVVEGDADGPEVDGGAEGLADRLAQHGPLVHVGVEVLLGAVEGDELLVVLQLARRPEVGQLVHDRPVVLDELHDVARLEVAVNQIVVSQMIHPGRQMRENKHELVLIETVTVLWVIEKVKETSTGA